MTTTAAKPTGRPRRPDLVRIKVRLCSSHCAGCKAEHWSEPLDATRVGKYVLVTTPHPVWHNAALGASEFRFCE